MQTNTVAKRQMSDGEREVDERILPMAKRLEMKLNDLRHNADSAMQLHREVAVSDKNDYYMCLADPNFSYTKHVFLGFRDVFFVGACSLTAGVNCCRPRKQRPLRTRFKLNTALISIESTG
jgi:hypothetical protein